MGEDKKANIEVVRDLASKLKPVKLIIPKTSGSPDSEALRQALVEAKEASMKLPNSHEARLAWETVEEIASRDSSVTSMASLYDECELELMETCQSLEEFTKAVGGMRP